MRALVSRTYGEVQMSLSRRALCLALAAGAALVCAPPALAAHASGGHVSTTGYDISYPQCGGAYPSSPAFGLVGVDGGLANDANACLASELSWALAAPGLTNPPQPAASLYVNTADPGPAPGVTDWPTSGSSSAYGTCDGTWSTACAYVYGEQRASYSYGLVQAVNPSVAAGAPWWLDIETANSWAGGTTAGYTDLNIAAIRGFVDGLHGAGAALPVGIYSTATQWNQITGLTAQSTAAALGGTSPPDWVAGGGGLRGAKSRCTSGGFTGIAPTLAQYSSSGYDADLRCG
jgi:hypothetical protein